MKFSYFIFIVQLRHILTIDKGNSTIQRKYCSNPQRKDVPIVYLTINPISTVSWLGKITQRQLVLNWKWPNASMNIEFTKGNKFINDWIGLFNINVSNGLHLEGSIRHQVMKTFFSTLFDDILS